MRPSKHVAVYYPPWVRYASDEDLDLVPPPAARPEPQWPPAAFRDREGKYAIFKHRRPEELARPTGIYRNSLFDAQKYLRSSAGGGILR